MSIRAVRSPDSRAAGEDPRPAGNSSEHRSPADTAEDPESVRRERDELRQKLDEIASVIGAPDAGKIVHDVRNVMNELVLLRRLTDDE